MRHYDPDCLSGGTARRVARAQRNILRHYIAVGALELARPSAELVRRRVGDAFNVSTAEAADPGGESGGEGGGMGHKNTSPMPDAVAAALSEHDWYFKSLPGVAEDTRVYEFVVALLCDAFREHGIALTPKEEKVCDERGGGGGGELGRRLGGSRRRMDLPLVG